MEITDSLGKRTTFTCPDCHGLLWEIEEGDLVRYRCHIGHAYSAEALSSGQSNDLVRALGSALRALEEHSQLLQRMSDQAASRGHSHVAKLWGEKARTFTEQANVIRDGLNGADVKLMESEVSSEDQPRSVRDTT